MLVPHQQRKFPHDAAAGRIHHPQPLRVHVDDHRMAVDFRQPAHGSPVESSSPERGRVLPRRDTDQRVCIRRCDDHARNRHHGRLGKRSEFSIDRHGTPHAAPGRQADCVNLASQVQRRHPPGDGGGSGPGIQSLGRRRGDRTRKTAESDIRPVLQFDCRINLARPTMFAALLEIDADTLHLFGKLDRKGGAPSIVLRIRIVEHSCLMIHIGGVALFVFDVQLSTPVVRRNSAAGFRRRNGRQYSFNRGHKRIHVPAAARSHRGENLGRQRPTGVFSLQFAQNAPRRRRGRGQAVSRICQQQTVHCECLGRDVCARCSPHRTLQMIRRGLQSALRPGRAGQPQVRTGAFFSPRHVVNQTPDELRVPAVQPGINYRREPGSQRRSVLIGHGTVESAETLRDQDTRPDIETVIPMDRLITDLGEHRHAPFACKPMLPLLHKRVAIFESGSDNVIRTSGRGHRPQ